MDSNDREVRQMLEQATRYLADADRREKRADERAKQLTETTRSGFDQVTRAIAEGFKLVHDAILDTRR